MRKECAKPLLRIEFRNYKGVSTSASDFEKVKHHEKNAKNKPQKSKLSILRNIV